MRRWKIGHGDRAISKTILHMQALVLGPEGVGHPDVRVAAIEAARGSLKNITEIDAVLSWVKQHIEFRGENAETLQSPVVTLQLRAGDCDDHSTLIAALLRSLGYDVNFKTVAASASDPYSFSHVYAVVKDKRTGEWKALDSTVPGSYAGWEPPMIYRQKTYRHKSLGDVYPPAPEGLGPGATAAYDIAMTAAQAAQNILAPQPPAVINPPLSASSSGLPTWVWLVAIGGLMFLVSK